MAVQRNFIFEVGASWELNMTLSNNTTRIPVDLTGYEGELTAYADGQDTPYLSLGPDEIMIDGPNGNMNIFLSIDAVAAISEPKGSYRFIIKKGDRGYKLLKGMIFLEP